jgi:hypothetical protein
VQQGLIKQEKYELPEKMSIHIEGEMVLVLPEVQDHMRKGGSAKRVTLMQYHIQY